MRLVLDQGVPQDAASVLRSLGYDCIHVAEIGMSKTSDEEILAFSLGRDAVVVTLDADFHTILAASGASGPSVIRLRLQGLGTPRSLNWFERWWRALEIATGCRRSPPAFLCSLFGAVAAGLFVHQPASRGKTKHLSGNRGAAV